VSFAGNQIAGLELSGQFSRWQGATSSTALARPVYFQPVDGSTAVVYFIENANGILSQYDALTGTLNWSRGCDCAGVEADFFVSENGNVLYYGDISGNVVAVNVGASESSAPTSVPTTPVVPSLAPVMAGVATTNAPVDSGATPSPTQAAKVAVLTRAPVLRTSSPTSPPVSATDADRNARPASTIQTKENASNNNSPVSATLIYILVAVCAALLLMVGLALFVFCRRRKQRAVAKTKEEQHDLENARNFEQETIRYENECKENEKEILGGFTTPRKDGTLFTRTGSIGSGEGGTPSTLHSIDERDVELDEDPSFVASAGCEISPNASVLESGPEQDTVRVLDDKFSRAAVAKSQGNAEELMTENDNYSAASSATKGGEIRSSSASVTSCASGNVAKDNFDRSAEAGKDVAFSMTSSVASGASRNVVKDNFQTTAATADDFVASMTSSVASGASGKGAKDMFGSMAGVDVAMGYQGEEKKDTDSVVSDDRKKIQKTVSIDKTVSPLPSPKPEYPEPGKIEPGQLMPSSPTPSVTMSVDDSVYMDESTIASLEMPLEASILMKSAGDDDGVSVQLQDDRPDDEIANQLRPGSYYLRRHQEKKGQDELPKQRPNLPQRSQLDKARPMYKGVSVRPSRSRAGIFSRRQPKMSSSSSDEDAFLGTETIPRPTVLPKKKKQLKLAHSTPTVELPQPELVSDQPQFTAHGYYVEEPDETLSYDTPDDEGPSDAVLDQQARKAKSQKPKKVSMSAKKKSDPWNILLNELSKVETQFFNPTSSAKNKRGGGPSTALPPADVDSDSDDSEPPPAPRTFYA
jgi:hypothetical protein